MIKKKDNQAVTALSSSRQTLMGKLDGLKIDAWIVLAHVFSLVVCAVIVSGFFFTGHPTLMMIGLLVFALIQFGITFNSIKLRKLYLQDDV